MKINIAFPFTDQPTGGGNQFLKALKNYFMNCGVYVENPEDADVVFFNSHPFVSSFELFSLITRLRSIKGNDVSVIHRVDGPISAVRGTARDCVVDKSIASFNTGLSDATVYQSLWSRNVCIKFGVGKSQLETTIVNAPDPSIFYPNKENRKIHHCDKLRIIASSWSSNWRKGFDIYRYLDRNLNFSKYEMIFVGNSPIKFKNIKTIAPLPSHDLATLLRECDIYISASVDDPCSNAVLEALHTGLPVVARNSGGHPGLVKNGGVVFNGYKDVLHAIHECSENIEKYKVGINVPSMTEVGNLYYDFAKKVHLEKNNKSDYSKSKVIREATRLARYLIEYKYLFPLSRRLCQKIPLKEAVFYRGNDAFRDNEEREAGGVNWDESVAYSWVENVLMRLPLFMDNMRHPDNVGLYRYSYSSDIQRSPALSSSVFASKIYYMLNMLDNETIYTLSEHIKSFQKASGLIADPWIKNNSFSRRLYQAARSRSLKNIFNRQTERAETRQSFAALAALGVKPDKPFSDIPTNHKAINSYIHNLDWSHPWAAGSHISHLVFFTHFHERWFNRESELSASEILDLVESSYRCKDGSWHDKAKQISRVERVNGAMKMITAYDACGITDIKQPEALIDLCLGVVNDGHACNHFNVISVLHRCYFQSDHRRDEIQAYCLDRLRRYKEHYWPWQGGFSFYPSRANDRYYEARVTTGMSESDIHGTTLLLWGIVLISEVLGWNDKFGLRRPIT